MRWRHRDAYRGFYLFKFEVGIKATMNAPGTFIDVHLFLPVSPTNRDDMEWVHYLHLPVQLLIPLSLRPFKFLRYMCFSIVASRGHLSFSKEHLDPVPYDSPSIDILTDGTLNIYYHLDADQQPYVFPINPTSAPNTPTSSVCSSNDSQIINFRVGVANRDDTCVGTDAPGHLCEVAHLIGITKGDEVHNHFRPKQLAKLTVRIGIRVYGS
jgi:hypothetical protein